MPQNLDIVGMLVAATPVALLVWMMARRQSLPSWQALPLAALVLYVAKLCFFHADSSELNASVVAGILNAYTPIMIVWGAIVLFLTMEATGCMDSVRGILARTSSSKVAQLMIIGWAFGFLIEGASGFGTPAALAAPMLVGLGFDPIKAAIFCLLMNSVPVSFGAVGTPTWFGLSELKLSSGMLSEVAFKTAVIHFAAGLAITPIGVAMVVGRREMLRNLPYIVLSTLSCTIPYLVTAFFNYEFPSLLGGAIGLAASVWLVSKGVGLAKDGGGDMDALQPHPPSHPPMRPILAFMPIWRHWRFLLPQGFRNSV